MTVLAIDIGTSGVRAAVYDQNLMRQSLASRRSTLTRKGPLLETSPEEVLANVVAVAKEAIATAPGDSEIVALSLGTQGEVVLPVDPQGKALAACPVSMDRRGQAVARDFPLSHTEFQAITGQPLHPMFSVFKIAASPEWLSQPDTKLVTLDGYVTGQLGADSSADTTMAARTGAFDIVNNVWSDTVLQAAGLKSDVFPAVTMAGQKIGTASGPIAKEIGLGEHVIIAAGSHDQAAAFWGGGGTLDGGIICSLGSSDCLTQGTRNRPLLPPNSGLATYNVGDEFFLTLAGTAAGGWALEWLASTLGMEETAVAAMVADMSADPTPVVVLPYHAGSGTLDNDPHALGAIIGLSLATSRGEIIRAHVEAAGFEMAKILRTTGPDFPPVTHINAVGGGAASPVAVQARVNALGHAMEMSPVDAVLRGAAIQAWCSVGHIPNLLAPVPPLPGTLVYPQAQWQEHYAHLRMQYRNLYDSITSTTRKQEL